jgi:hypothetical protein
MIRSKAPKSKSCAKVAKIRDDGVVADGIERDFSSGGAIDWDSESEGGVVGNVSYF